MARRSALLPLIAATLCWPGNAVAQDPLDARGSTAEALIAEQRAQLAATLETTQVCDEPDAMQPDTIVVCRRVDETDSHRDPLPAPVESDKKARFGFEVEPCVPSLLSLCVTIGAAPPPPVVVDLSAFPEPLSAEDAALVFAIEEETED